MAKVLNMDRLCLNAQCSLETTTTWPAPHFFIFSMIRIFSLLTKGPAFLQNTSGNSKVE